MDNSDKKNYVVARENDGTIQVTFTIDKKTINANLLKALEELGKEIEIPGFRKGNAPTEKVKEHISKEKLTEKTLSGILPKLLSEVLTKEKIKPSIYPKFELISADDDQDWQVRALICEIPDFELGEYKSKLKGLVSSAKIWTPGSTPDTAKNKELTRSEKEQQVIDALLKTINLTIPRILIEEEVNSRLSQLLSRIEKLGLTLDGYLSSIGKDPKSLRSEYEQQSQTAIKIELILEKVSLMEKLSVSESDIEEAIKANSNDPKIQEGMRSPEQLRMIKTILLRRKALDFLLTLI